MGMRPENLDKLWKVICNLETHDSSNDYSDTPLPDDIANLKKIYFEEGGV